MTLLVQRTASLWPDVLCYRTGSDIPRTPSAKNNRPKACPPNNNLHLSRTRKKRHGRALKNTICNYFACQNLWSLSLNWSKLLIQRWRINRQSNDKFQLINCFCWWTVILMVNLGANLWLFGVRWTHTAKRRRMSIGSSSGSVIRFTATLLLTIVTVSRYNGGNRAKGGLISNIRAAETKKSS